MGDIGCLTSLVGCDVSLAYSTAVNSFASFKDVFSFGVLGPKRLPMQEYQSLGHQKLGAGPSGLNLPAVVLQRVGPLAVFEFAQLTHEFFVRIVGWHPR